MSVIVGVVKNGTACIAADSCSLMGEQKETPGSSIEHPKVVSGLGYALGVAGRGAWRQYIEAYLRHDEPREMLRKASTHLDIFDWLHGFWKSCKDVGWLCASPGNDDDGPFNCFESAFLILNLQGLWEACGDFTIDTIATYRAIGNGSPYAIGALHALYGKRDPQGYDIEATDLAMTAVRAACAFDRSCGGPILVHTMPTAKWPLSTTWMEPVIARGAVLEAPEERKSGQSFVVEC